MIVKRAFLKWVWICATGEFLGIACAAAIAVGVNLWIGEPDTLLEKGLVYLSMLVSGVVEGSILGAVQARGLRSFVPSVSRIRWIRLTVAVAVMGWALGGLPAVLMSGGEPEADAEGPSFAMILVLSAGMGMVLGALFGLVQWIELRRCTRHTVHWITANAVGWTFGMFFIFLFATLPDVGDPVWFMIMCGAIGGMLAGMSVGVATGVYLLYRHNEQV
jgi:hypothetical protein